MNLRPHGLLLGGCLVLWTLAGCAPPAGTPLQSASPVAAAPQAPTPAADDRLTEPNDVDKLIRDLGGKGTPQPQPRDPVKPAKEPHRQQKDTPPPDEPDGVDTVIKKHRGNDPAEAKGQHRQEQEPHAQADVTAWVKGLKGDVTIDAEQSGRSMVEVDLAETRVTDDDLARLQGLSNLRVLNLNNTNIRDAGLKHLRGLTSLEELSLSATDVTDAGLVHLRGLSNLRELQLGATSPTVFEIEGAVHGSERPGRVGDPRMRITDAGLVHLERLTNLESLDLSGSKVTNAGLAQLAGLSKLQDLDLSETGITDAGLARLRRLSKLEALNLSSTGVTDAGLAHLKGLTQLRELDISDTQVTAAGLARQGLTQIAQASGGELQLGPVKPGGGKPDAPPDKGSPPPPPRKPSTPAQGALPRYFDQLNLTQEQVDRVMEVAQAYDSRINHQMEQLKRLRGRLGMTGMVLGLSLSIKKLTNSRQQKLEQILTDEQRDKLDELRSGK